MLRTDKVLGVYFCPTDCFFTPFREMFLMYAEKFGFEFRKGSVISICNGWVRKITKSFIASVWEYPALHSAKDLLGGCYQQFVYGVLNQVG